MSEFIVCALYKFTRLESYQSLQAPLLSLMQELEVRGTLLLASEGINGTIAGSRAAIDQVLHWLSEQPGLDAIECKESVSDKPPFKRSKVKLKKEIVTLGVEGIDPRHTVGTYVEPEDWNDLIEDPDVVLVDTRNDYECQVGTFKNAINPKTESFREFPQFAKQHLDPARDKKIAMFCTGGIRCEKSTALLKEMGFDQVFHLKGGILKYLEKVPEEQTRWQGECFVFDDRVTVDHDLMPGSYEQCHACRLPISEEDMQSEHYVKGVSCPNCFDKILPEDRQRFAERQKQIELAAARGEVHIGKKPDDKSD